MAKKRPRRGGRYTPKGTRPAPSKRAHREGDREPDLLRDVHSMVSAGHPFDLLCGASQFIEITTERPIDRLRGRDREEHASLGDLVATFIDVDRPETTALLVALATLVDDEILAARIRREVAARHGSLPDWLRVLEQAEITDTWEMVHVLGDGDNILVGVRWPTGHELTAVVYIDHNVGTLVKDAYVVPEGPDALIVQLRRMVKESGEDERETLISPIDPADARVRITEAIAAGEICLPPFETEMWPGCRSLVEWLARRLPPGGAGYERPEWTDAQRDDLARSFFASEHGAPLASRVEDRELLESLLWFACDYGPGDPLRWSPVVVEIILLDWFPRKVVAPPPFLAWMPVVLRAFVRYAHTQRGISAPLTRETLAAVDAYEPQYQELIRSARPQGAHAVARAALGAYDVDADDDLLFWDADRPFEEIMLEVLADAVGGPDVLDRLDVVPLRDEAFDWTGIADDIVPRLREILTLTDRYCEDQLDLEYRTIVRRLLARAATGDPDVFRRRARTDYTAAALVWLVGRANDLFSPRGGGILVKDLLASFGMKQGSVSQRAGVIRNAAGLGDRATAYELRLGDPALLHSTYRSSVISRRDKYRAGTPY